MLLLVLRVVDEARISGAGARARRVLQSCKIKVMGVLGKIWASSIIGFGCSAKSSFVHMSRQDHAALIFSKTALALNFLVDPFFKIFFDIKNGVVQLLSGSLRQHLQLELQLRLPNTSAHVVRRLEEPIFGVVPRVAQLLRLVPIGFVYHIIQS